MRMHWVLQVGTAVAGLLALAACSSSSTSGTGAMGGETTTASGTGATGGTTGTGTFTGTKTCADVLTAWDGTLTGSDFSSEDAYNAYDALNTCACVNKMAAGGCDDLCKMGDNTTTTPNFCDGVAALSQCEYCLNGMGTATGITENCGSEYTACSSN